MTDRQNPAVVHTASKADKACVFCRGSTILHGRRYCKKGTYQLYLCKSCGRRFSSNTAFGKMKHKAEIITLALDLYYKGLSLRKVCNHLESFYGVRITHPTILSWVRKYVAIIKRYTNKQKISPAEWNADETAIPMRKRTYWAWDIIDRKSRYLVAMKLAMFRHVNERSNVFQESQNYIKRQPKIIVTDGFKGYVNLVKDNFPATRHIQAKGVRDFNKIQYIESHHSLLKDRYKTMRGFKSVKGGQSFLDGWKIYYNFIRPHSSLDGLSPAQAAGIHVPNVDNRWLWLIEEGVKHQKI